MKNYIVIKNMTQLSAL